MKRKLWLYAKWLAIAILFLSMVIALPVSVVWKLSPYSWWSPINVDMTMVGKTHRMHRVWFDSNEVTLNQGVGHYYLKYVPGDMEGHRLTGDCLNVQYYQQMNYNKLINRSTMGGSGQMDFVYEFDVCSVPATVYVVGNGIQDGAEVVTKLKVNIR